MWRTLVGMIGGASETEQRALIDDCWEKTQAIVDETLAHIPKDQRWEQFARLGGRGTEALLEISGHLTQMRLAMISGRTLSRAEIGVLRAWQEELMIARRTMRETAAARRTS